MSETYVYIIIGYIFLGIIFSKSLLKFGDTEEGKHFYESEGINKIASKNPFLFSIFFILISVTLWLPLYFYRPR